MGSITLSLTVPILLIGLARGLPRWTYPFGGLLFGYYGLAARQTSLWLFLHSTTVWKRILSLIAGFVFASVIGSISYATWDWAAYYGFPSSAPESWYVSAVKAFLIFPIWIVVLLWPALVGLARRIFHVRKMA